MRTFLIKIIILPTLLIMGIIIIILIPLPENSYHLAIIDKHRILASTDSPKIVLAGGSNLAFGIDSAKIQNELRIPVVNMGLQVGFGLGRIIDDISPFINSGDILLIVPEYEHFINCWNGSEPAYELIFDVKQYRLLYSSYYGLPNYFSHYLATHLLGIIQRINNTSNPLAYSRDGFNEYGDYIKHLNMKNLPFTSSNNIGSINRTYLNRFFQLIDDLSERGITAVLSYPSYEEQSFYNSAELIQELDIAFRTKRNILVISHPESYCFPTDYFYDMVYHLNSEERSVRTDQLIQDLQASGLLKTLNPRE